MPFKFNKSGWNAAMTSIELDYASGSATYDVQEMARIHTRMGILNREVPWLSTNPEIMESLANSYTTNDQMLQNALTMAGTANLEVEAQHLSSLPEDEQWRRWVAMEPTTRTRFEALGYTPPIQELDTDEPGKASLLGQIWGFAGDVATAPADGLGYALSHAIELGNKSGRMMHHAYRTLNYIDQMDKMEDESLLSKLDFSIGYMISNPGELARGWKVTEIDRETFSVNANKDALDALQGSNYDHRVAQLFAAGYTTPEIVDKLIDEGLSTVDPLNMDQRAAFSYELVDWINQEKNGDVVSMLADHHVSFGESSLRDHTFWGIPHLNPNEGIGRTVAGVGNFTYEWVMDPLLFVGGATKGLRAVRYAARSTDGISDIRNARALAKFADTGELSGDMYDIIKRSRLDNAPNRTTKLISQVTMNRRTMEKLGTNYWDQADRVARAFDAADDYSFGQLIRDTPGIAPALRNMRQWEKAEMAKGLDGLNSWERVFDYYESTEGLKTLLRHGGGNISPVYRTVPMITRKQARWMRTRENWTKAIDWARLDGAEDVMRQLDGQIETLLKGDITDPDTIKEIQTLVANAAENQGRVARAGRRVVRTPAKFAAMFQAKVPLNRGFINVADDTSVEEFARFVNFGIPQGLSRSHMDDLIDGFVRGTDAQRDAIIHMTNRQLMFRTGLFDPNALDDYGQRVYDKIIAKAGQHYGIAGLDDVGDGITGARAALFMGETSPATAVLNFEELMTVSRKVNFLRRARFNPKYNQVEAMMNRVWKPAQLLTYSFVLRAGGEEGLTFALRNGPSNYFHSHVWSQWARGIRNGRRQVIWDEMPELMEKAYKGDSVALAMVNRNRHLQQIGRVPTEIQITQEAAIMRPLLWFTNSMRNWRRTHSSQAAIRFRAARELMEVGVSPEGADLVERMSMVRNSLLNESKWSRFSIRADEIAQNASFMMSAPARAVSKQAPFLSRRAWGNFMTRTANDPVARQITRGMRHQLNDQGMSQKSFAEMQAQTFSPFSFTDGVEGQPRTMSLAQDRLSATGYTYMRIDPKGSEFAMFAGNDPENSLEFFTGFGAAQEKVISDPLTVEIVDEFDRLRDPTLVGDIDKAIFEGAALSVPDAFQRHPIALDYYRNWLHDGSEDLISAMERASGNDPIITQFGDRLRKADQDTELFGRALYGVNAQADELRFLENDTDFQMIRQGMIDRQVGRLMDPRNRPYVEKMERLQTFQGSPIERGIDATDELLYTPLNHASGLGYYRDLWNPGSEGMLRLQENLTVKLGQRGYGPDEIEEIWNSVIPVMDDYGVQDGLNNARAMVGGDDKAFVSFTPFATTNPELARLVTETIDETLLDMGRLPEAHVPGVRGSIALNRTDELAAKQGVRYTGTAWDSNPYFQLDPTENYHVTPFSESNAVTFNKWDTGDDHFWIQEGMEAQTLGHNHGLTPTDTIVSDRASFEMAARQMASDQVDAVLRIFGARRRDYMSPMTEFSNHARITGRAHTIDDMVRLGNRHDMPAEISGPVLVTSKDAAWDRFVEGFFENVADPSIAALARTPMYQYNYAAAMEQTQPVREALRSPGMRAKMEALAEGRTGVGMDWFDDLVESHWHRTASKEAVDTDIVVRFAKEVQDENYEAARRLWHSINDDAALQHYADEIFEEKMLNLRVDQGRSVGFEKTVRAEALEEARETFDGLLGTRFSWTDEDLDFLRRWANQEKVAYDEWLSVNADRAASLTIPFIDDHRLRSQFQGYVGHFIPFWYAEEQFLRRMWRTMSQSPEALRKGQIMMNGMRHVGLIKKDEYGNEVFVMPNWFPGHHAMNTMISTIYGSVGMRSSNRLTTSTEYLLPGYSDEPGHFQYGPFFEFGMAAATRNFWELEPQNARWRGGDDRATTSQSVMELFMPSAVVNVYRNVLLQGDGEARLQSATWRAMQRSMASDDAPEEDADGMELTRWRNDMIAEARVHLIADTLMRYVAPGGARQVQEEYLEGGMGYKFMETLRGFTSQGLSYADAITLTMTQFSGQQEDGSWLNPALLAYNVFATEGEASTMVQYTSEVYDYLVSNEDLLDEYGGTLAWALPYDGEADDFERRTHDLIVASGLRTRKDLKEVERDLYLSVSRPEYYRVRESYDRQIFEIRKQLEVPMTGSQEQALKYQMAILEEEKANWSEEYLNQHPLLAETVGAPTNERETSIHQLWEMMGDPRFRENEVVAQMTPLMAMWMDFKDDMETAGDAVPTGEVSGVRREMRYAFEVKAEQYVRQNPQAYRLWTGLLLPELRASGGTPEFEAEWREGTFTTEVGL